MKLTDLHPKLLFNTYLNLHSLPFSSLYLFHNTGTNSGIPTLAMELRSLNRWPAPPSVVQSTRTRYHMLTSTPTPPTENSPPCLPNISILADLFFCFSRTSKSRYTCLDSITNYPNFHLVILEHLLLPANDPSSECSQNPATVVADVETGCFRGIAAASLMLHACAAWQAKQSKQLPLRLRIQNDQDGVHSSRLVKTTNTIMLARLKLSNLYSSIRLPSILIPHDILAWLYIFFVFRRDCIKTMLFLGISHFRPA